MAGNGEATQKQVEEAVNRLVDAADKVGDALDEAGFEDVGEGMNEMAQQARQIQQDDPWLWQGLSFGIAAVARHLAEGGKGGNGCGQRMKRLADWDKRGSSLRAAAVYIHQGFPAGNVEGRNFRNQKTTAVALIRHPDGAWECVYAVSGNNTSPEVRRRAEERGYARLRGDGGHAEQILINNLPSGAILLALAPCRPACTDDTTRTDRSCTTAIRQQSQAQGQEIRLFDPVGGQNRCV